MVLAVLEARCGVAIGLNDVYLNIAGGLRVAEPAADLAVAAALMSSLSGEPVAHDTVVFGEIGLSGEVRPVGQTDQRLKEAAKLGFGRAILPRRPERPRGRHGGGDSAGLNGAIGLIDIAHLEDLRPMFANAPAGRRMRG
jgi:DNA repair protein RadA/Sms